MGTTTSRATNVTVNTTVASNYADATFAAPGMSLLTSYTATAADSLGRRSTNTVSVNLAASMTFQYDGNGNLTNDGLRSFAYDDENQLLQVWTANWLSEFTYDGKMRRRIRQEFTLQGANWMQTNMVDYVYDGNEVIQERNVNYLPTTTYTRGKDLSGILEGAGGISGLLSMTLNTQPGTLSSNSYFYHADGNGNVTMLINSSQFIVAKYLYDAFGNTLSAAGSLAQANLYRFSSKEAHPNSGLIYYLYRYYDPNLQRWPNRDPQSDFAFSLGKRTANFDLHYMLKQASHQVSLNHETTRAVRGFLEKLKISQANSPILVTTLYVDGANVYTIDFNNPVTNHDPNGDFTLIEGTVAVLILAIIAEGLYDAWEKAHHRETGICPAPPPPPPDDGGDDYYDPFGEGEGEGGMGEGPAAP
jgi:RHS repeat-associated protein